MPFFNLQTFSELFSSLCKHLMIPFVRMSKCYGRGFLRRSQWTRYSNWHRYREEIRNYMLFTIAVDEFQIMLWGLSSSSIVGNSENCGDAHFICQYILWFRGTFFLKNINNDTFFDQETEKCEHFIESGKLEWEIDNSVLRCVLWAKKNFEKLRFWKKWRIF